MLDKSKVVALIDMIGPSKDRENVTRDIRLEDIYFYCGIECVPAREVVPGNMGVFDDRDLVILPHVNNDWVNKEWNLYLSYLDMAVVPPFVYVMEANPVNSMTSPDSAHVLTLIRALRESSAIMCTSTSLVPQISTVTDTPAYSIPLPVSSRQIEFRIADSVENRSGVYLASYEQGRGGVPSLCIASRLSEQYGEAVYCPMRPKESECWASAFLRSTAGYKVRVGTDVTSVPWLHDRVAHIGRVSSYKLAIYTHTFDCYGRNILDCAVAGIPCLCFAETYPSLELFPYTSVPYGRWDMLYSIGRRLMEDVSFYNLVVETATSGLADYSYERVARRFEHIMEAAVDHAHRSSGVR